jgi:hypothetical protein
MTTLTPAELVRRAHPLVSDLGGRYYFAPVSLHRAAALGLSPSQWYFLGRGGALGDVDAAVAPARLATAPLVVRRYWDSGRSVVPPQARAAYMSAAGTTADSISTARRSWSASTGRGEGARRSQRWRCRCSPGSKALASQNLRARPPRLSPLFASLAGACTCLPSPR